MTSVFISDVVSGTRGRNDHNGVHEVELENLLKKTPGYQFPLPKQCEAMYGRDYYPALTKFVSL